MLIVEGPDGAGKTTLINQLQQHFPTLEVAPRVVTKDAEAMTDLKEWVKQNLEEGWQWKIFDRHRLISEFIYGPLLREAQEPGFNDLVWAYNSLSKLEELYPLIIYCLPPLETVKANLHGDPDNKVVEGRVEALYTSYVHRAALDLRHPEVFAVIYDYTGLNLNMSPEEQMADLLGRVKSHRLMIRKMKEKNER